MISPKTKKPDISLISCNTCKAFSTSFMPSCSFRPCASIDFICNSTNLSTDHTLERASWVSNNNIFLISIDRFLAVTFLQRYRTVMTLQSLRTAVGATWSLSLIMGISAVFSRKAKIISQYFVIIVLTAVFCLCTRTLMVVHVKARSIMRHLREADLRSSYHLSPILNRERTLAKTVGIIIAAFYISFLPLVILPFFTAILRKNSAAWNAAWQAFPWVNTLALCGSSINPYIYYWRSARFRMALKTIRLAYLKSVTI